MDACIECGAPRDECEPPRPSPLYDPKNVFARILSGEIPCRRVAECDVALAFHDISPLAKVHVVVVPKRPSMTFDDYVETDFSDWNPDEIVDFWRFVSRVVKQLGLDKTGYRLITNNGPDAEQTVPHFHVHILGGEALRGL